MPNFAANLSMMFNEVDFTERFKAAADTGFKAVEYLFPYDYSKEQLVNLLGENDLLQVLHNLPAGDWNAGERGIACHPDRINEFREGVGLAAEYASALGCPQVNCLAGIKPASVSEQTAQDTFIANLRYAAPIMEEAGVKLIIESINTIDIPGFFLNRTNQATELINLVSSDNLYLQHDIYHMQIMEGDLARTIESNLHLISHMQLADNPGRHEPGTGEINYEYLFDFIDGLGYQGWIGCEYVPAGSTVDGLDWIARYIK
ncbi:MAG: hydroxypyruvate isomerase [SAR202 cluster bacterium]|jgi:hydroxypyruvate isomerase|nr:MAG: hydroxypyruvate isomerase [SAR202 cluster bacterium]MEC8987266.1 hydroxypyruvate isomerase [Chloroflexota bacterium]MED5409774.1 hydroxypyruvate isomerase [Chloroflexota bacterium]